MFEFHGWFSILMTPNADDEDLDVTEIQIAQQLKARIDALNLGGNPTMAVFVINAMWFLRIDGHPNHRGSNKEMVDELLTWLAQEAPGSYGMLYWRDDEAQTPDDMIHSYVDVMLRGKIVTHADPFLSPFIPVVADPWMPED